MKSTSRYASVIDLVYVQSVFSDDKEIIQKFFEYFIVVTELQLKEMKTAIAEQNPAVTQILFHTLKGSSGMSGVLFIPGLCTEAEKHIMSQEWDHVRAMYVEINEIFEQLKSEIKTQFK